MFQSERVINYCVKVFTDYGERQKSAKILEYLALDGIKYESRENSPHWRMLMDLIDNYYAFKAYCENLIANKCDYENEIISHISIMYAENVHMFAGILQELAGDEEKHGSRENAPHWKMLKVLINNKPAFQTYTDALYAKHQHIFR